MSTTERIGKKKVVQIGGGTGTSLVLRSLKNEDFNLTALMTMADDGGANGVVRREFGMLPFSGIRQAIATLLPDGSTLQNLFQYRFSRGGGLEGMTFGNLFLVALTELLGSEEKAIQEVCNLLDLNGHKVLPVSDIATTMIATYESGETVRGEHNIDEGALLIPSRITKLELAPSVAISQRAESEIRKADYVIFGPGDLFGNTVSNLIVEGLVDAICTSRAEVIFILNLVNQLSDTPDFTAYGYLEVLNRYLTLEKVRYVLVNSDDVQADYPESENVRLVDDLDEYYLPPNLQIVRSPLLGRTKIVQEKSDKVVRSKIRHDDKKLNAILMRIINERV